MLKGEVRLTIPNPHEGDVSKNLLNRILNRQKLARKIGKSYKYNIKKFFKSNEFNN